MDRRHVALLLLAGCGGDEPVEPGGMEVAAATFIVQETGGDLDLDGYDLLIDGRPAGLLTGGRPRTLKDLTPGSHDAELRDIEPNCTARSGTTVRFTVAPGTETRVAFELDCVATGVLVTLASTGVDGAVEYPVTIDGIVRQVIRPGLEARITRIPPGSREIALASLPVNCAMAPQKSVVSLAAGDIAAVSFSVTCLATTGVLRIRGEIRGEDVDPNGYLLNVDTHTGTDIGPLGDRAATLLISAGAHLVALDGVAPNCAVDDSSVRRIEVVGGGLSRDTLDLSFQITCQRAYRLAFARGQRLALSNEQGSHVELATVGGSPVWSPDGEVLAYACGAAICRLGLDGTRFQSLPTTGEVRGIAWSPDGDRLAYAFDCPTTTAECRDGLTLVSLDGLPETRVPLPPIIWDLQGVSWSPDGSRIAFGCAGRVDVVQKICTVAPDGGNFARLVPDAATDPSWSPDGSKILFTRWDGEYTPYLMNADGSGSRPVSADLRGWSGGWISNTQVLVSEMECYGWYGCWPTGISSVEVDGAARVRLTAGEDRNPAWRP